MIFERIASQLTERLQELGTPIARVLEGIIVECARRTAGRRAEPVAQPIEMKGDGRARIRINRKSFSPGAGTLHAVHRNAVYNCCPDDITVALTIEGATLRLDEEEILTMPCDCECCFDVNSTVVDLEPGTYTVEYCWHDDDLPYEKCHTEVVEVP